MQSRIQMDLFKARQRAGEEFRARGVLSGLDDAALPRAWDAGAARFTTRRTSSPAPPPIRCWSWAAWRSGESEALRDLQRPSPGRSAVECGGGGIDGVAVAELSDVSFEHSATG